VATKTRNSNPKIIKMESQLHISPFKKRESGPFQLPPFSGVTTLEEGLQVSILQIEQGINSLAGKVIKGIPDSLTILLNPMGPVVVMTVKCLPTAQAGGGSFICSIMSRNTRQPGLQAKKLLVM